MTLISSWHTTNCPCIAFFHFAYFKNEDILNMNTLLHLRIRTLLICYIHLCSSPFLIFLPLHPSATRGNPYSEHCCSLALPPLDLLVCLSVTLFHFVWLWTLWRGVIPGLSSLVRLAFFHSTSCFWDSSTQSLLCNILLLHYSSSINCSVIYTMTYLYSCHWRFRAFPVFASMTRLLSGMRFLF